MKRSSLVKTPKPTPVTTVEGTSVTPRQRPKGQAVSTGPISLSGQIVSQISGQGTQPQSQSSVGNTISYVQMGQQLASLNASQPYLGQNMQASVQPLPVNSQPSTHQVSTLTQVSPQVCCTTTNQNVPFGTHQSQIQKSQQSQSQCSTIRRSPVSVQDTVGSYYFDSPVATNVNEENLEALFPPSGKKIYMQRFL